MVSTSTSIFIDTIFDLWYSKKDYSTKLENEFMDKIYDYAKKKLREGTVMIDLTVIKPIATEILTNSNCYDVVFKFIDGREIKAHKFVLNSIGYFTYINEFYDHDGDEIIEYLIDYKYDDIYFIINHLYTGEIDEEHLKHNFINIIILSDYLLVSYDIHTDNKTDNILLYWLMAYFRDNYTNILSTLFTNNNNYNVVMDIVNKIWDIFENNESLRSITCIQSWFRENIHICNSKKLLKNQIFLNRFGNTEMYKDICVYNCYFDMFPQIITLNNIDRMCYQLFNQKKKIRWDILDSLFDQYPQHILNTNTLDHIPKIIFTKTIFDKLPFANQLYLICKFKIYQNLNQLNDLTRSQLVEIINVLVNNDINNGAFKFLINKIKMAIPINYKNNCYISNSVRFVHIHRIYPLYFQYLEYIGKVSALFDVMNKKGITIYIDSTDDDILVTKNMQILIANNCCGCGDFTDIYTIKNIYCANSNRKHPIPTLTKSSSTSTYQIMLKIEKFNRFDSIRIDMPVFLINNFF